MRVTTMNAGERDDFRELASLQALFDLVRSKIHPSDLPGRVMGDPGTPGYIRAYTQLLGGGWRALEDEYDGGRLCDSFDIGENLLCFHSDASRSDTCRWFSLLASCIQLYAWDGFEGPRGVQGGTIASYLLDDAWSLEREHGLADAWALAPELFRGLRSSNNMHFRAVAVLGEILSVDEAEKHVALCQELLCLQRSFEDRCVERDGEWEPNYWHLEDPIWDPLIDWGKDMERWEHVLRARFPRQPETAQHSRELFLGPEDQEEA